MKKATRSVGTVPLFQIGTDVPAIVSGPPSLLWYHVTFASAPGAGVVSERYVTCRSAMSVVSGVSQQGPASKTSTVVVVETTGYVASTWASVRAEPYSWTSS